MGWGGRWGYRLVASIKSFIVLCCPQAPLIKCLLLFHDTTVHVEQGNFGEVVYFGNLVNLVKITKLKTHQFTLMHVHLWH